MTDSFATLCVVEALGSYTICLLPETLAALYFRHICPFKSIFLLHSRLRAFLQSFITFSNSLRYFKVDSNFLTFVPMCSWAQLTWRNCSDGFSASVFPASKRSISKVFVPLRFKLFSPLYHCARKLMHIIASEPSCPQISESPTLMAPRSLTK